MSNICLKISEPIVEPIVEPKLISKDTYDISIVMAYYNRVDTPHYDIIVTLKR
jgi:hypothetical protein